MNGKRVYLSSHNTALSTSQKTHGTGLRLTLIILQKNLNLTSLVINAPLCAPMKLTGGIGKRLGRSWNGPAMWSWSDPRGFLKWSLTLLQEASESFGVCRAWTFGSWIVWGLRRHDILAATDIMIIITTTLRCPLQHTARAGLYRLLKLLGGHARRRHGRGCPAARSHETGGRHRALRARLGRHGVPDALSRAWWFLLLS